MLERIENTISRYNMIPPGIRLGVAVSGGADSVFLAHVLARRARNELTVLHLNHGLRGAESDEDAAFVEALARQLGAGFTVRAMGKPEGNVEQFSRRARQAFFAAMREAGTVDRVATGHTASDQAETVVMRLLRGAGTTGLRGVLPVTAEGIVRPLLEVGREEVREWLRAEGIAWREDGSNASGEYLRNRVRGRLLPVMRELDAQCEAALGRVAELAALDEDYWRGEAEAALGRVGRWERGALVLRREGLAALHPALLGRVIRLGLEQGLGSLRRVDRRHVEAVAELAAGASGEGGVEVPGGRVTLSMDWIRIGEGAAGKIEAEAPGEFTGFGYAIRAWVGDNEENATTLDWEQLRPPLRIRGWEAGDRFQPAGASETKLVKEFFERERVPSWDRRVWPMITDSDGIVWIYRMGASVRAAERAGTRVHFRVRCDTVSSK